MSYRWNAKKAEAVRKMAMDNDHDDEYWVTCPVHGKQLNVGNGECDACLLEQKEEMQTDPDYLAFLEQDEMRLEA